jgi:hypothetical protein
LWRVSFGRGLVKGPTSNRADNLYPQPVERTAAADQETRFKLKRSVPVPENASKRPMKRQ